MQRLLLLAGLTSILATAASAQELPPSPPPTGTESPELKRGALPEAATTEARRVWQALLDAARPRTPTTPTGFDLTFDGRARDAQGQSNDFDQTRYRFLPPDSVRTTLRKDLERLRGPAGDFLIEKGRAVALEGREYEQDRREILETLAIARNFLALADPRQLRLAKLELSERRPNGFPSAVDGSDSPMGLRAGELDWLMLESPDFHLLRTGQGPRGELYRVDLGLDRASRLPVFARIAPVRAGGDAAPLLVEFGRYSELDGFQVPRELRTYELGPVRGEFDAQPRLELWLLPGGKLRPVFGPDDFLPPKS